MSAQKNIHATAAVHESARLGENVVVGPCAVVEENVVIGEGCRIMTHAVIMSGTEMGPGNTVHPFACIGGAPQDVSYRDEPTRLVIGSGNVFRESVTLNRGTPKGKGVTVIGDNCFFMACSHVGHDCHVGDNVVMANSVALGGHVVIENNAVLGGLAGIHQFLRIGTLAMIAGGSFLNKDVPPYTIVSGYRGELYGLNLVGLKRKGFDSHTISGLKKAYQILFRSGLTVSEACRNIRSEITDIPEVEHLAAFVESSQRGVSR